MAAWYATVTITAEVDALCFGEGGSFSAYLSTLRESLC